MDVANAVSLMGPKEVAPVARKLPARSLSPQPSKISIAGDYLKN